MESQEKLEPIRRPLQALPAMPLNKRPPPIATTSSPLETISTLKIVDPITPPATPIRPRSKRSSLSTGSISLAIVNEEEPFVAQSACSQAPENIENEPTWETTTPLPCTQSFKLHTTTDSSAEYGRGAWSIVHRAHSVPLPKSTIPTPPTSPMGIAGSAPSNSPTLLAVKAPARRDAYKILDHEARILTYLHAFRHADEFVVPFYGYDASTHSILLEPIPLNLDSYAKSCTKSAKTSFSTRTMFDPVIGLSEWKSLAKQLISGLAFLHKHQCIHGDVKPANILLHQEEERGYQPVYCDFSSAAISTTNTTEITALTPDYSAPELLSSLTKRDTPALPTREADVFALGVTLLFAATGESPYATARMEIQKTIMAREGRPLDFARNGEQAARVRKRGLVEAIVGEAVGAREQRWTAETWVCESERVLESAE